jgi:cell shape-determining protein MreC
VFEEVIFSSNIIKTPQETEQKKEEEKEKLQESLQIKGKLIFWEEENTSTSKILFDVIPFSPLHHTISKTLSKVIEKVF